MDLDWKKNILLVAKERDKPGKDREFVELVYQAENKCDLDAVRILMKTFYDLDDYGTQESVNSVFSTVEGEILIEALLEELPRLAKDAPEWAHYLVGREMKRNPKVLELQGNNLSGLSSKILKKIIENRRLIESDTCYKEQSNCKTLIANISGLT